MEASIRTIGIISHLGNFWFNLFTTILFCPSIRSNIEGAITSTEILIFKRICFHKEKTISHTFSGIFLKKITILKFLCIFKDQRYWSHFSLVVKGLSQSMVQASTTLDFPRQITFYFVNVIEKVTIKHLSLVQVSKL